LARIFLELTKYSLVDIRAAIPAMVLGFAGKTGEISMKKPIATISFDEFVGGGVVQVAWSGMKNIIRTPMLKSILIAAVSSLTLLGTGASSWGQYSAPPGYTVSQLADTGDFGLATMTIDQATGNIYIGSANLNVWQVTLSGLVTNIGELSFPYAATNLEFDSGQIYLANGFSDNIESFNITTGVDSPLTGFPGEDEAGAASIGGTLYFTSGIDTTPGSLYSLSLSDTNTLNTISTALPANPSTLKYDPANGLFYFSADGAAGFYSYDLTTGVATALNSLPDGPFLGSSGFIMGEC
jgi:hypothetical protein